MDILQCSMTICVCTNSFIGLSHQSELALAITIPIISKLGLHSLVHTVAMLEGWRGDRRGWQSEVEGETALGGSQKWVIKMG